MVESVHSRVDWHLIPPPTSSPPTIPSLLQCVRILGCGAVWGYLWFQLLWDASYHNLSIAEKELIPIILAVTVWGAGWQDHQVVCHCDNQVVREQSSLPVLKRVQVGIVRLRMLKGSPPRVRLPITTHIMSRIH